MNAARTPEVQMLAARWGALRLRVAAQKPEELAGVDEMHEESLKYASSSTPAEETWRGSLTWLERKMNEWGIGIDPPVVPPAAPAAPRELHGTKGTRAAVEKKLGEKPMVASVESAQLLTSTPTVPTLTSKPKSPWLGIFDGVFERQDLDTDTKALVLYLLRRAGKTLHAFPSRKSIARAISVRVSSVDRHLKIAKEKRILDGHPRITKIGLVNEYALNPVESWAPDSGPGRQSSRARTNLPNQRGVAALDGTIPHELDDLEPEGQ